MLGVKEEGRSVMAYGRMTQLPWRPCRLFDETKELLNGIKPAMRFAAVCSVACLALAQRDRRRVGHFRPEVVYTPVLLETADGKRG